MIEHKEHFHGSDLEKIEAIYGIKKEDIISFSANVNPLGISYRLRQELTSHIDAITSYPDREYTSLRKAIANYVNTNYEKILVGNGSTELISLVIKNIQPKAALLIAPTYSEYEHELTMAGSRVHYFQLKEEQDFQLDPTELEKELTEDIHLLVLCNPNNPTSTQISREQMTQILSICKERNIFVMVDETYVEFSEISEEITAIPLTDTFHNLIVLRGISKFFAAPGLRLGYAISGNADLLNEINRNKNPWTINSLAAIAGEIMFQDEVYIKETKTLISTERARICRIFDSCSSVKYYPPHGNFILVHIKKEGITANELFEACIRQGLMIRDCSTFPSLDESYFRFCFMKPEDNDALLHILLEKLGEHSNCNI